MRALNAVPDGRSDTVTATTTLPAITPLELSTTETVDVITTRIMPQSPPSATSTTMSTLRTPPPPDLLHDVISTLEKAACMLKSENRKV